MNYERTTSDEDRCNLADQDAMQLDQALVTRVLADLRACEAALAAALRGRDINADSAKYWTAQAIAIEAERDSALRALDMSRDENCAADDHIAECQMALDKLGIKCGADGSVVVGIGRLEEARDSALREVERLRGVCCDLETAALDARSQLAQRDALIQDVLRSGMLMHEGRVSVSEEALTALRSTLAERGKEQVQG